MKKFVCLLSILSIYAVEPVFANVMGGMDPGAINSQYMRDMRTFEVKSRAKQKNAIVKQTAIEKAEATPVQTSDIKTITFVNNRVFSSAQLTSLVKDKLNQPMNFENIAAIRKSLMKFYQSNGYYSAVPIIVSQDNTTGELVIQMDEGTRNSIVIE